MGKLEKVGAAVVGVLLCIIVFVGVMNRGNTPNDDGLTDADREAAQVDKNRALRSEVSGNRLGTKKPRKKKDVSVDLDSVEIRRLAAARARKKAKDDLLKRSGTQGGKVAKEDPIKKDQPKPRKNVVKGAWPREYIVKKNDILGSICRKVYGTSRMTKAVMAANPDLDVRRMIPGKTKILLPAPTESVVSTSGKKATTAKLAVKSKRPGFISNGYISRHTGKAVADKRPEKGYYIVRKNDSLSSIAQKQLGSIKFTKALLDANRGLIKNPNSLREGWKLKLPNVN